MDLRYRAVIYAENITLISTATGIGIAERMLNRLVADGIATGGYIEYHQPGIGWTLHEDPEL